VSGRLYVDSSAELIILEEALDVVERHAIETAQSFVYDTSPGVIKDNARRLTTIVDLRRRVHEAVTS
jgi:hypothetical protein